MLAAQLERKNLMALLGALFKARTYNQTPMLKKLPGRIALATFKKARMVASSSSLLKTNP
jgi:hypothetical protein